MSKKHSSQNHCIKTLQPLFPPLCTTNECFITLEPVSIGTIGTTGNTGPSGTTGPTGNTGPTGGFDVTLTSAGGTTLVNDGVGPALAIKGLVAGTSIGLTSTATTITINNIMPITHATSGSIPIAPATYPFATVLGTRMTFTGVLNGSVLTTGVSLIGNDTIRITRRGNYLFKLTLSIESIAPALPDDSFFIQQNKNNIQDDSAFSYMPPVLAGSERAFFPVFLVSYDTDPVPPAADISWDIRSRNNTTSVAGSVLRIEQISVY